MAAKKRASKAKSQKKSAVPRNYFKIHAVIFSVLTLLLALFMYIGFGGGVVNTAVTMFVCGMFGKTGYFLPIAFGGCTVYLFKTGDLKKFWIKFTQVMLLMINASALAGLYNKGDIINAYYYGANAHIGGGLLGTCVSAFLMNMVQTAVSYILLLIAFVLFAGLVTGIPLFKIGFERLQGLAGSAGRIINEKKEERKIAALNAGKDEESEKDDFEIPVMPRRRKRRNDKASDDEFRMFDAVKFPDESEVIRAPQKSKSIELITDSAPVRIDAPAKPAKEEFSDGIDEVFADLDARSELTDTTKTEEEKPKKAEKITEQEKDKYIRELDKAIEHEPIEYVHPPLSLLKQPRSSSSDLREELRSTAQKLISILDDFGVKAKLLQVTQGPAVTRFEIQPDTGVKLSKIVGLADDMALNLAVPTVLVAPVPGKAAVGIEIPNNKVSSVSIREILDTDAFANAKSTLTVALGKDIGGNVVIGDIAKMPHVLIAGATGSGKSVCINTIITSILYKASPEDVKLIMVDPKVVELGVYNGIPHLLIPVVTEPKKAAGALNWAVAEMMKRYDLFKETGVRKLEAYNKLMENRNEPKIPQIVIIIDELADLMMVAAKEVEDYICRLAQLARAAGIHLIIATQRPSVDVITGLIKANIPSRIAFAVSSQVDSRTILDKGGAEKLLGMGDMLYHPMGARNSLRVQGAFVSDEEIENVLDFIREHSGDTHYSEDLEEQIERCATGENGVTPDEEEDGDALLPDAISLAVELGKISTSMVQRRLGVGYSRAGRIIDQMEARGIISGANGSKPRKVFISHADMAASDAETENEE